MNWFLVALVTPISAAFINHFDKYLISRFTKDSSIGSLILFSSLFAVVVPPILLFFDPSILSSVTALRAVALMINGGLIMLAILFYFYALESHEASYIAPMFEFIPVFSLILGYYALGEKLISSQIWAIALIILGSIILSLELQGKKTKIKPKLILLMIASSFLYAINAIIFKFIAVDQGFSSSLFWDMSGKFLFGVIIFLFVKQYRKDFLGLIKSHHYYVIGLNVIGEIISLIGMIALVYAVLLAPVALVQTVGSLQTVFVFILGVIFTLLFPRFSKESMLAKHLTQKIVGIAVITAGVYLLEIF